ncbi:MAG: Nramp family divalent metal transporter [Opitutaceae bacterium]|jgi:Mn2+/Fe2+ NRAMP family transporter|nr:Nramp family divalent metal transporter [Opitutaceae bacterium]
MIDLQPTDRTREAPEDLKGTLREIGPGIIIAGSVVGSGELIATTIAGAEAGFWLLWIILIGCIVKVSVQLEVGRAAVLSGRTTLALLSDLPGWKPRGLHWIAWVVLAMLFGGIGQMGGVLGGVGQALAIAAPMSGTTSTDVLIWALLVAVVTAALLWPGRYRLLERIMIVIVGGFTLVSVFNVFALQGHDEWAISARDIGQGLSFQFPPGDDFTVGLTTALAAFGIIGMAAGEIFFYPYWCLKKGYGSYTGISDGSDAWRRRAEGWLRVMKWDAFCSMAVYTISTVAFYLLGAAVLARSGLKPGGAELIQVLSEMYQPVFGTMGMVLFLGGACVVLYSTFLVNNASSALVWADVLRGKQSAEKKRQAERILGVALPLGAALMFVILPNPRAWVVFAGITQTLTLPLLGYAAVRFRFSPKIRSFPHHRAGDIFLLFTVLVLVAAATTLIFLV